MFDQIRMHTDHKLDLKNLLIENYPDKEVYAAGEHEESLNISCKTGPSRLVHIIKMRLSLLRIRETQNELMGTFTQKALFL